MQAAATEDTITLGHLTDLSGPFGAVGKEYVAGAELFVKNRNADGGVCDRDLALEVRDHGYDAQKAATAYRELSDKVFGMESILGDGMASALLPQLERESSPHARNDHDATMLSASQVSDLELNLLSDRVLGGALYAQEGRIDTITMCSSLLHRAGEQGANFVPTTRSPTSRPMGRAASLN